MMTTVAKWGNSRGLRIPSEACSLLGIQVGSKGEVQVDQASSSLIVRFERRARRYGRRRVLTMEEFAEGWEGGRIGEEWGGPDVGAEVVR